MRDKQRWLNILHTAGQFFSTTVVAFIALLAVFFVGVRIAGLEMFSVESGSMSPVYPKDTLVFVQKVDPQTIEVGDIVTYVLNADGVLVTHRVVEIDMEHEQFYTKGDANNSRDPNPVLWGNTVGKVVLGIPKLGAPIRYLTAENNRAKVIGVLIFIGVVSLLWDILERIFKKRKPQPPNDADSADTAVPNTESRTDETEAASETTSEAVYEISDRKKEDILYKY